MYRLLLVLALAACAAAHACPPPIPEPTAEALQAAAQRDRGLLWRIEKGGRTSWLFGTLHIGRPEWQQPGPRVLQALADSDVLALEIDPADAEIPAPARKPPVLPAALKARLDRALERNCLNGPVLAGLPQAMQAMLLSIAEARWVGLDAEWAQEMVLHQHARAAGRPVVALETVAAQAALLSPADAREAAASVTAVLDQIDDGSARSVLARLAAAWEQGDERTLADYERWCACVRTAADRAAMRALNDDRNPAMADRIAALHGQGRRVFAAVGALHMTGPRALPRLMAARGFTVERIAFGAQ